MSRNKRFTKMMVLALSISLVLSLGLIHPAQASEWSQDTFENGDTQWTSTGGSWSVVQDQGNAVYYQSGKSEGRSSAGDVEWSDYAVAADVKVVDFNGSTRTYVAGRYTDANNYYAASLYNSGGGKLEIRKKVNGSTTTLATKLDYKLAVDTWYNVKLEMSGPSINMYVNGVLELSATDTDMTKGSAGLVTLKSIVMYDNVTISNIGDPVTETPTDPTPETPPTDPSTEVPPTDPSTETPPTDSTPEPEVPDQTPEMAAYNVTGFAAANTTGGGIIEDTDSRYMRVYNASDLAVALKKGSKIKVVEIMNDLDLGWNEIPASAKTAPFSAHNNALTHPVLMKTGVSRVSIDNFDGLTIFSSNGATIKHAAFTFKRSNNIIIRNLAFDELWEWDEATKGNYDKNDWDYITVENSSNVWIDHATFHKAYDGLVDVKKGSRGVTISWSSFVGDDQGPNSWVTQQVNALEANMSAHPMYAYLRSSAVGMSKEQIIAIASSQKKGHLIGATEFASDNADLEVTLHHNYYKDIQDRMPRVRGGNVHVYNIVMDNADTWEIKKKITSSMSKAISAKGYHFGITSNGAISTEDGAVLLEKSVIIGVQDPLRNNQVSASKSNYTGKIKAIDTIYVWNGASYRGGSEDAKSPLAPGPAAEKSFAWNGFASLPYNYEVVDPADLQTKLNASGGAGAGQLVWAPVQWLTTSYN
ncbi:family 16 glycoside hydrolase [Paenibacillus xylanexedens]|uniref:pectate lyase family protein n=1 Tax=Paenibacillus xylanexedens TaxID=528191 RepID=UPI00119D42F7|nr:family 16 glycoside hydrolase [Paenibacillus xylanexedens]